MRTRTVGLLLGMVALVAVAAVWSWPRIGEQLDLRSTTTPPEPLARVSFESPHDLIVLTATVEGESLRMLLDSGASVSFVDTGVAERIGLTAGQFRTHRSPSASDLARQRQATAWNLSTSSSATRCLAFQRSCCTCC